MSRQVSSGRGAAAQSLDATLVTPSLLAMLGARPAIGRFFTPDEELDDAQHVAVLGYEIWQSRFAADKSVLGRSIDVAGVAHTIVGVAPNGFTGVDLDRVDVWLPIGVANRIDGRHAIDRSGSSYNLACRLESRWSTSEAPRSSCSSRSSPASCRRGAPRVLIP